MKQMRHHLRRLPKEDYDRAIEYFEEYFEEAGPDHEQQAIEDLGSPEIAADQIIRDLAMENAAKPNVSVKRGMSAVWVGILAVFAAPIGLPLALAGEPCYWPLYWLFSVRHFAILSRQWRSPRPPSLF